MKLTIPNEVRALAQMLGGEVIPHATSPQLCQVIIQATSTTRLQCFSGSWRKVLKHLRDYQPKPKSSWSLSPIGFMKVGEYRVPYYQ